ncbi:hypothetical protein HDU96_004094 [Phlyctochytrium bullatum]|nr:hypothetical protein HDU96_004094 [Phlyctochytrium bullatum]
MSSTLATTAAAVPTSTSPSAPVATPTTTAQQCDLIRRSFPSLTLDTNNCCNKTGLGEPPEPVYCDPQGQVIGLYFGNRGIGGSISPSILTLPTLRVFIGKNNSFTGPIPDLGQIGSLQWVDLNTNNLTGTIPTSLSQLPRLVRLDLGNNQLTGTIPDFVNASSLRVLNLGPNSLSGSLSQTLGRLFQLEELAIPNSNIDGPIPPQFGNLQQLRVLNLEGNKLTGAVPKEIGLCGALEQLVLRSNKLNGQLPTELSKLVNLKIVTLSSNGFSGVFPSAFSSWTKLEQIAIRDNSFSGPIPDFFARLPSLTSLFLNSNFFSGKVPEGLNRINNVRIENNCFKTADLPSNATFLGGTTSRSVDECAPYLSGTINPSSSDNSGSSGPNPIILGAGIGVPVLLIIVAVVGFLMWRKKKADAAAKTMAPPPAFIPPAPGDYQVTELNAAPGYASPIVMSNGGQLPYAVSPTVINPANLPAGITADMLKNEDFLVAYKEKTGQLPPGAVLPVNGPAPGYAQQPTAVFASNGSVTQEDVLRNAAAERAREKAREARENSTQYLASQAALHRGMSIASSSAHTHSSAGVAGQAPAYAPPPQGVTIMPSDVKAPIVNVGTSASSVSSNSHHGGTQIGAPSVGGSSAVPADGVVRLAFTPASDQKNPNLYTEGIGAQAPGGGIDRHGSLSRTAGPARMAQVAGWTTQEVEQRLLGLGVASYFVDLFRDHEVNGYKLLLLTDEKLFQMGVDNPSTRSMIMFAVDELRSGSGAAGASSGAAQAPAPQPPSAEKPPEYF